MTEAAIAVAPAPLCELPAAALRVAAAFAGQRPGVDHISIRPGHDDGEVVVVGCAPTQCAEVRCTGLATAEVLLPVGAVRLALQRLPAEHASVVIGDDRLATLRLYCTDSTLAVAMPTASGPGVRMPDLALGEQIAELAIDAGVLASVAAKLRLFGVVAVATVGLGWALSGEAEGLRVRALVAGVRQ